MSGKVLGTRAGVTGGAAYQVADERADWLIEAKWKLRFMVTAEWLPLVWAAISVRHEILWQEANAVKQDFF